MDESNEEPVRLEEYARANKDAQNIYQEIKLSKMWSDSPGLYNSNTGCPLFHDEYVVLYNIIIMKSNERNSVSLCGRIIKSFVSYKTNQVLLST